MFELDALDIIGATRQIMIENRTVFSKFVLFIVDNNTTLNYKFIKIFFKTLDKINCSSA